MNELYIGNCRIYFSTEAKNVDDALDEFVKKCEDAGIDVEFDTAELLTNN